MLQQKTTRSLLLVLAVLVLAGLACNMPAFGGSVTPTPIDSTILLTRVAQTLAAGENAPTKAPAATKKAQDTPVAEQIPTNTPAAPTNTPQPQVTATQACDIASFISDVTVPDGAKIPAGQAFTKTWRLQNVGTCAWNKNYALIFASGDAMGAPAVINLQGDVPTNALVDLSIEFKAPAKPGKYASNWKLRNASGRVFGVSGDQAFFVMIEVVEQTLTPTVTVTPTAGPSPTPTATRQPTLTPPASGVILDFVSSMCKAKWRSQAGDLPCPGTSGDPNGYVMRLENPKLETGANESSPVLLMVPQDTANGALTGTYPAIPIANGDHFQATLGCLADLPQCKVIYQLNYSVNGGATQNLQQWTQVYDGSIQGIDVDLSSLAGKSVELILVVLADGPIDQARAVWVYPRIIKR